MYLYNLGVRVDLQECVNLQDNEASALGVSSPATGNPSSGGPTISTVGVIANCVDKYFERFSGWHGKTELQGQLIGEVHVKELNQKYNTSWYSMTWSQVDVNLRQRIVDHLIFHILGPDVVIEDYQQVNSALEFKKELNEKIKTIENQSVMKVLAQLTLSLVLRDESLSY